MLVPADLPADRIGGVYLPFPSGIDRSVVIFQIVGLYVARGIFSAYTVNAFPMSASLGIDFQALVECIGESFRYLPAGVAVDGFVSRIRYQEFRLVGILRRGVLPSVGMLQLEVGIRAPFAELQPDAVVLTDVAVAARTGRIL